MKCSWFIPNPLERPSRLPGRIGDPPMTSTRTTPWRRIASNPRPETPAGYDRRQSFDGHGEGALCSTVRLASSRVDHVLVPSMSPGRSRLDA